MPTYDLGHPTLNALPEAIQEKIIKLVARSYRLRKRFGADISLEVSAIISSAVLLDQELEPLLNKLSDLLKRGAVSDILGLALKKPEAA